MFSAPALAVTLTFDELPFQPVDGLSYQGVTFDFKVGGVDSTDANYNAFGPGILTYVQDPSLEGSAFGVLTLDFAEATPIVDFGVALSTPLHLTAGVTVELFDASLVSLGSTSLDLSPLVLFAEGRFTYSGTPVGRAVIDFDETSAERFVIDNLSFRPIPEPSTAALALLGVLALVSMRRMPPLR